MGGLFGSCTSTHLNAGAVDAHGISSKSADIDEAALQAVKGGIGEAARGALKQNIELSFAMEKLPNLDTFSKTDAFCILYELKRQGTRTIKQFRGRTECIYDNLDPKFVTSFDVDYYFEETQSFMVEGYDMDDADRPDDLSK